MTTPSPAPAIPPPSTKGNKVILIILGILLAFFLLIGGCVAACTYFVKSKAEEYGAAMEKNPQMATLKFAVQVTPGIEIVSEDEEKGILVLRKTETGEEVTVDTTKYTAQNIGQVFADMARDLEAASQANRGAGGSSATPEEVTSATATAGSSRAEERMPEISAGKAAALNATLKRLPDFVTPYPGATVTDAQFQQFGNQGFGNYEFITNDTPETISEHYEKKLEDTGFTVVTSGFGSNDDGVTATLVMSRTSVGTMFALDAQTQRGGKVKVTITSTGSTQ